VQPRKLQHDDGDGAISALRGACFSTTAEKLSPFSRAVRIYCAVITFTMEARVMRAM